MNILNHFYKSSLLTEKELMIITERHKLITIPKGQFLLTEGQYPKEYYCIQTGLARHM